MEQNNNNNQAMNNNPTAGEKTFSQDDVNRIVSSRLAQEKAKSEANLAEREQQLTRREMLFNAKEKIDKLGLPMELLDVLDVSDETKLDKALNAVRTMIDDSRNPYKVLEPNLLRQGDHPEKNAEKELRKAMGLPD